MRGRDGRRDRKFKGELNKMIQPVMRSDFKKLKGGKATKEEVGPDEKSASQVLAQYEA